MKNRKKALVLGGGGSRGAYEIGVWKALLESGYTPDIVTGTSVGAINGAMVVQGRLEESIALWSKIRGDMVMDIPVGSDMQSIVDQLSAMSILAREAIVNQGADTAPLRRLLEAYVDEAKVRDSKIDFGLVTVTLPALKPCAIFVDEMEPGQLITYLLASSAVFPAMRGQVIHDVLHIDGGYYDNLPIELAIKRGAQEIITVNLHAPGRYRRKKEEQDIPVHTIETEWDLGNILLFDSAAAAGNMELGYLEGLKFLGTAEGVLYTFRDPALWGRVDQVVGQMIARFTHMNSGRDTPAGHIMEVSAASLWPRLLRCVGRFYQYHKPEKEKLGLTVAEMAGKLYKLSPARQYSVAEFEAAVLAAEADYAPQGFRGEWEEVIHSDAPLRERVERLRALPEPDGRIVCRWMRDELRRGSLRDAEWVRLLALGFLFPQEMLVAGYLCEIEGD